jgi:hypothetical protein
VRCILLRLCRKSAVFPGKTHIDSPLPGELRRITGLERSELAIGVVEDGIRDPYSLADDASTTRLLAERFDLFQG